MTDSSSVGLWRGPVTQLPIHPELDPLDIPALRDLARFGVMADDQLARRYADSVFGFNRLLQLKEARVVSRWREALEGSRVYSPTRLGRLIAGVSGVHPRTTYPSHLAHDVAVVDLADHLLAHNAGQRWLAEDEVREFLDHVEPPPRRVPGDVRHRPDGLLLDGTYRIGIELEHSDKFEDRYTRISAWFVREWRVDRVRWYVDNPRIIQRLRQINSQHGFDHDMTIEIESFPPGVRLRQRAGRFES